MRHVILEGPDGAGKTTLARRICADHQMAYHHEGVPPSGNLLHYYGGLLANATRPTVFDRLHLGETIYGPLLRGESRITEDGLVHMTRVIRGTGTSIVVCLPPWAACRDNNTKKRELIEDERKLLVAYQRWTKCVAKLEWDDLKPNYSTFNYLGPNGPFDYVIKRPNALPDGVIGSPWACCLFVGERVNSKTLDLAFFGNGPTTGYLHEQLKNVPILEKGVAFTNAYDVKGKPRDFQWIESQMPNLKRIVCLGQDAVDVVTDKWLTFASVETVPHPQYWKRFHHHKKDAYTERLREAMKC